MLRPACRLHQCPASVGNPLPANATMTVSLIPLHRCFAFLLPDGSLLDPSAQVLCFSEDMANLSMGGSQLSLPSLGIR